VSTLDICVALLRGTHIGALLSLFGTLVFRLVIAPAAMAEATVAAERVRALLLRLTRICAACSLITGLAWLITDSAVIAGASGTTMTLHAVPTVALHTQFGQWLLSRFALLLLLLLLPLLRTRRMALAAATALAGAALSLQPMLGHAGAIGGSLGMELIASEILHLLAAGAWLGGLLPLFITVGILPPQPAATACRNFTPIGLSAVLILGVTAVVQVGEFMGGLPGLLGTTYGRVALVKLGLFVVLLVLAALNRLLFTERLAGPSPVVAQRHIRVSIAIEAVLGTLVILTAGFLASQTPGTHEQPVWPFVWRPSLSALYDPDLRGEVVVALIIIAGAIVTGMIGLLWRRARYFVLAISLAIIVLEGPHLTLLFVEAYPTSFYTSPTEFAATAIAHGAKLFATHCAICHGTEGRGDGPSSRALALKPADLTADHLWGHSDGELYWYIAQGFEAPQGGIAMPGFAHTLSTEAIWDLIDYLHANNAGASMRRFGQWRHPIPLPQFDAECPDGSTVDLDDLRNRLLRIVFAPGDVQAAPTAPPGVDVTTILVTPDRPATPPPDGCIASEPEAWTALSVILGASPDGVELLADQNAWLRAAWRSADGNARADVRTLEARIHDIAAHPLAVDAAGGHVHRH
jgi:putative copper export protein/mono/diheme cytochrome c family protein